MKGLKIQRLTEQRGIVLVLSLLVMTILSVLGLAFLATARTEDAIAVNYRNHTAAFYAAEAGLESGVASLKSLLGTNPTPTDPDLARLAAPALTDPNYTFDAFQVRRIRPTPYNTTLDSGPFVGLNAQATAFEVTATARGPRGSRAQLTQKVQYLQIPLFQFAVFYGKGVDLEITPWPPMTINGRVHANSNIYMYAGQSLHFDSYVTTSGNIYRYAKDPGPGSRRIDPMIKGADGVYHKLNFDHEYDYDFANPWAETDWKNAALSTFGGMVQDSAMGVTDLNLPLPDLLSNPANPDVVSHQLIEKGDAGDSQALKDAKMYYEADLRIENGSVVRKDGTPVDLNAAGCDPATLTTKTFWDDQEKADITVTELDIGKLNACSVVPNNGVLYVYNDVNPGEHKGVRLVNGAELPSQGLTVASENPIYVQGDYNTVNKAPAAVMGDAITILSNNWGSNNSDAKGDRPYATRKARNTTVNAAFATGPARESVPGQGNGQMENVIRYLEDWRIATINYNGSIVALWHSLQAKGDFICCGRRGTYFYPPRRNYTYDTLFDTSPPPGTPMGIAITRGQWSEG